MKILVSVKRVVDYNVRVQLKPDGSGVMTDGVKMSMNPFDEIAVEEAVRLKERGMASEIAAVTIGGPAAQEQLRSALAMGADRAVHVLTESLVQPLQAATILAALVKREAPDMVLMGKQAIDDDCGQTPQMLAALLNWPQATFASRIELERLTATVTREVDAGLEVLSVDLPAVISTDLRLNEPRYIKLPDIMKARKKPVETVSVTELGVELPPGLRIVGVAVPPTRKQGKKVGSVAELVAVLKEKGVLG
jgi:electron transfer flavoprotein beta subunit